MIPYNTDAPLYHWPIGTVGLIVVNTLLFLAVPRYLVDFERSPQDIIAAIEASDLEDGLSEEDRQAILASLPPAGERSSAMLSLEYGRASSLGSADQQTSCMLTPYFDLQHDRAVGLWLSGSKAKSGWVRFLGMFLGMGVVKVDLNN